MLISSLSRVETGGLANAAVRPVWKNFREKDAHDENNTLQTKQS